MSRRGCDLVAIVVEGDFVLLHVIFALSATDVEGSPPPLLVGGRSVSVDGVFTGGSYIVLVPSSSALTGKLLDNKYH